MKRLKDNSDAPEARLGTLPKKMCKLKEKEHVTFYSPAEEWVLPAASTKEPEVREFVEDSGGSMHVVSKRDLNSVELETMRISRSPTTVMTAIGEVQTGEEAIVFCQTSGLLSKLCFLKELLLNFFTCALVGAAMPLHTSFVAYCRSMRSKAK